MQDSQHKKGILVCDGQTGEMMARLDAAKDPFPYEVIISPEGTRLAVLPEAGTRLLIYNLVPDIAAARPIRGD